jgi:ketosteroid isomerase-like protein
MVLVLQAPPADPIQTADRRGIEEDTHAFLQAFENLDMARFIAHFADDASAFFPSPEPPSRVDGKSAIQRRFELVFQGIRAHSSRAHAPFHRLEPHGMTIQLLASDVAVVSFQLENTERVGRRTLVLKKRENRWLIAHLHASNSPGGRAQ